MKRYLVFAISIMTTVCYMSSPASLEASVDATEVAPSAAIANLPEADMGGEERICPEIPSCPPQEPCPVAVCPIEGKPAVDFKALSRDSAEYIEFLRREVYYYLDDSSGKKVIEHLMAELTDYYFTYRDVPGSEEALYLKSRIYADDHEYEEQLLSLLKIIYEYPDGAFFNKALSDARALMNKKFKRDIEDNPSLLRGAMSSERSMNHAAMIEEFVKLGDKRFLDVQNKAFDEFLAYYPRHIKADLVMTFKSNNYIRRNNYEAAAHIIRRQVAFYPKSPLRPENLYLLGLVYSDELKEYQKAVDVFAEIIDVHPDSSQAISAHERSAELYNKKLKANDKATGMLEDIVRKYPGTDAALRAFTYMAAIFWDDRHYSSSMDAYMRQSVMFAARSDDAVTALFEAARVAEKGLKDNRLYVDTLVGIYEKYPDYHRSAEALYEAGNVYEDDLKDVENAKKYYAITRDEFSEHKLATSAASKLDRILERERKEEEKRQRETDRQRQEEEAARLKEQQKYEDGQK